VKAAHIGQVPGRKTDKADARRLAKLMRYGLLQASFIPPAVQRDSRDLTRYRTRLVQERGREVNRVQGVNVYVISRTFITEFADSPCRQGLSDIPEKSVK
jgi:transposase